MISTVPCVHQIRQLKENLLELVGLHLETCSVFFGVHAQEIRHKSAKLIHVLVSPSINLGGGNIRLPLLLVNSNGVVFKTGLNHMF